MPRLKLTKTVVETAQPEKEPYELRDAAIPGFLLKVTPTGRKVFMVAYAANNGQRRKPAIGRFGEITVEQARAIAQDWLADVRKGKDPSAEKSTARRAPTTAPTASAYLNKAEAEGLEHPFILLAVRLQFEFAARMSEILKLEWAWINLDNHRVEWPDSKTGGMSKPISAEAVRLLEAAPRLEKSPYVCPHPSSIPTGRCRSTPTTRDGGASSGAPGCRASARTASGIARRPISQTRESP
jgi:integrase